MGSDEISASKEKESKFFVLKKERLTLRKFEKLSINMINENFNLFLCAVGKNLQYFP
jgi:hypothetical protein